MWLRRFTVMLLTVLLFSSMGAQVARAQSASAFTVPPGGRVQVTFIAFCIDFGTGSFPSAIQAPNPNLKDPLAIEPVRKALIYARNNKVENDPRKALEVQKAIWRLYGYKGITGGDDVMKQAASTALSPPAANTKSIIDSASFNKQDWDLDTISWDPIGEPLHITDDAIDHFYARGLMIVKNNTKQQLSLYMPEGTIIYPAGSGSHQRVAAYSTGVQIVVMPKTASVNMSLVLAVFTSGLAVGIHLWRTRRQTLWFRRAA